MFDKNCFKQETNGIITTVIGNMKKIVKTAILLLTLLIIIATAQFVNLSLANPYFHGGQTPPPTGTEQPKIIVTLENNSIFLSNNITFKVTATSSQPINFTDKRALNQTQYMIWQRVKKLRTSLENK